MCRCPFSLPALALLGLFVFLASTSAAEDDPQARAVLKAIGTSRGLCAILGDPRGALALTLARNSELKLYVQSPRAGDIETIRRAADTAGLLGTRIFAGQGDYRRLHLADDLADAVIVGKGVNVSRDELLRILRPGGKALQDGKELIKPFPTGTDEWTHPYHLPDNNPLSTDQRMRRPYLTHFLAEPWYCPLPEMSVISAGRIFKVFGDRSSARPQEALINTLLCLNAFNGTELWRRQLTPGFMIHRNTFIATPQTLFLADNKSCKLIDPATGKVRDEIVAPADLTDGPVWKWMALNGNILYALVGEKEGSDQPLRGSRIRGAGWPWWKIKDYPFGFGRTILAIDPASKKVLWHHREKERIDSRGMCMKNDRIYFYSNGRWLGCLDARSGKVAWKNRDKDLLDAIGEEGSAQHWLLGFASTAYLKCSDDVLYFAGPQRPRLVAASTRDGKLLWQRPAGNVQLVVRSDSVYALGEGSVNSRLTSYKLEPLTGKVLANFPSRDRCTRATGCLDSIFTRGGKGGSTAIFDLTSKGPKMGTIAPMRPACQDGVVVAHGYLFWGPWMCRCDMTQLGVISLGPGESFDYTASANERERLENLAGSAEKITPLPVTADDWPAYRKDNARTASTNVTIPATVERVWEFKPNAPTIPTAPVTAGGLVLTGGADGVVRALEAETGKTRWTVYTGGPMKYPPAISDGRAYVGSGDGWVYCLEARTGRLLWRFRAAPVDRFIPVYGSLSSTWPIGSGVLVDRGVVYAAAGITSLDGTHVFALDAITGKMRWQNHTSAYGEGNLPEWGASVQGHLLLHDNAIYMASGNQPTVASYAVADGKFSARGSGRGKDLFIRNNQVRASGFPLYWRPEDDHFLSAMELETPAGVLSVNTSKLGLRPAGDKVRATWGAAPFEEIAAVAVTKNAVLVSGLNRPQKKDPDRTVSELWALSVTDGKVLWKQPLPAPPVLWGLAVDRTGRILVSLTDGRVLGFAAK